MQQVFYHKYGLKTNIGGGIGWDNVAGDRVGAEEGRWARPEEDDRRVRVDRTGIGAGVTFTPGGITYHFSNTQHYGFPPSQIALARLYGTPRWPGFYYAASVGPLPERNNSRPTGGRPV